MNTTMTKDKPCTKLNGEAGFTLTEALMAMMILTFGLASIFNLMIVAQSSNSVANRASAATMIASRRLETLRSTPFASLVNTAADSLETQAPTVETVAGVGTFETRWLIQELTSPSMRFIQVRTEPRGFRGRWARAEMTTIRSCTAGTAAGCP